MAPKKELPHFKEKLPTKVSTQLEKRLGGAITTAKSAPSTTKDAAKARQRAAEVSDPSERQKFEQQAAELDKLAKHSVKVAKRLENGALQGAGAGVGIGAATGLGLGAAVGTIVGGVTAVPTALLGGLIGAGTGAVHGPWVKFSGKDKSEVEQDEQDGQDEQKVDAQESPVQQVEPIKMEIRDVPAPEPTPQIQRRKAPRKLEIRNRKVANAGRTTQ